MDNPDLNIVCEPAEVSGRPADAVSLPAGGAEVEQDLIRVYGEYAGPLLRYATALTRDPEAGKEGLQETFLRYYVARTGGQRIANTRSWLFRVMRNYVLDHQKGLGIRSEVSVDEASRFPDANQDPELLYRNQETVHRVIECLAPRELETLRLRAAGLRYEEIAEVLNIRCGTVGALLFRALRKVRGVVGGDSR